jgi:hypothetical protein
MIMHRHRRLCLSAKRSRDFNKTTRFVWQLEVRGRDKYAKGEKKVLVQTSSDKLTAVCKIHVRAPN